MQEKTGSWGAPGDVNAFFGLMLDNVAGLVLLVSLLSTVFGFPTIFALRYMVPGTAIGVLVGDLLFFWMSLDLARRTGRDDITAMPLGLDTPSTFGMVFFVLGPAYLHAQSNLGLTGDAAATYAWHIGIWSIVWSGLFKIACSFASNWVRSLVPRAGLLGSLAAIALVLISFLPLLEILHFPVVGLVALAIVLTALTARIPLPGRIPGMVGALVVAGGMYYLLWSQNLLGYVEPAESIDPSQGLLPVEWLTVFRFEWVAALQDSLHYLPIVLPLALATVIGGIDCTESAAAAGDEFDTDRVVGVEALATLAAGLCGGVIQTTPYIGHPAYKAMGGRSAYVLATALFIGTAGLLGYFGFIYAVVPKAAVYPILIFIGLEITAQSFHATPRRHYPAVVLSCIPALAALAMIFLGDMQGKYTFAAGQLEREVAALQAELERNEASPALRERVASVAERTAILKRIASDAPADWQEELPALDEQSAKGIHMLHKNVQTLRMLNGGFIITSLLWASLLAAIIDRRLWLAALWSLTAAACALFGIIHSPLPGSPLVNPLHLPADLPLSAAGQTPLYMAAAYVAVAVVLLAWHAWGVEQAEDAGAGEVGEKHE